MSENIVLPIKPEYVDLILKGEKKYEFRKRACKDHIKKIYIYETAPVKSVVAEVMVDDILKGSPDYIWNACKESGGISKDKFYSYFKDSPNAVAYKLGRITIYDKPKQLIDFGVESVPQSFIYVK